MLIARVIVQPLSLDRIDRSDALVATNAVETGIVGTVGQLPVERKRGA